MKTVLRPLLVFSASIMIASGAMAEAQTGQNPCASEIQNYCSTVAQDSAHVMKCLLVHNRDLSENCRGTLEYIFIMAERRKVLLATAAAIKAKAAAAALASDIAAREHAAHPQTAPAN